MQIKHIVFVPPPKKTSKFSLVIKDGEIRLNLQLNISVKKASVFLSVLGGIAWGVINFIIKHHIDIYNLLN